MNPSALPTTDSYEFFTAWGKKCGWKNKATVKRFPSPSFVPQLRAYEEQIFQRRALSRLWSILPHRTHLSNTSPHGSGREWLLDACRPCPGGVRQGQGAKAVVHHTGRRPFRRLHRCVLWEECWMSDRISSPDLVCCLIQWPLRMAEWGRSLATWWLLHDSVGRWQGRGLWCIGFHDQAM